MQFNIEIISVGQPVSKPNTKGGTYNVIEVVYKRDGKIEGKKLIDWAVPEAYKAVNTLGPGDFATVTTVKDDAGYWKWTELSKSGVAAGAGQAPTNSVAQLHTSGAVAVPNRQAPAGTPARSNYETPEERAAKQRNITRQFSINAATAFLAAREPKGLTMGVKDMLEIASELEAHVYNNKDKFADLADDIPE